MLRVEYAAPVRRPGRRCRYTGANEGFLAGHKIIYVEGRKTPVVSPLRADIGELLPARGIDGIQIGKARHVIEPAAGVGLTLRRSGEFVPGDHRFCLLQLSRIDDGPGRVEFYRLAFTDVRPDPRNPLSVVIPDLRSPFLVHVPAALSDGTADGAVNAHLREGREVP